MINRIANFYKINKKNLIFFTIPFYDSMKPKTMWCALISLDFNNPYIANKLF